MLPDCFKLGISFENSYLEVFDSAKSSQNVATKRPENSPNSWPTNPVTTATTWPMASQKVRRPQKQQIAQTVDNSKWPKWSKMLQMAK